MTEWISTAERLPDEREDVLVWYAYEKDMYDCEYYSIGWQIAGRWHIDNVGKNKEVLAWMPLPEPYKGENNDLC